MRKSLVTLLESRARKLGEREIFHFLTTGDVHGPMESLSLAALAEAARGIAHMIRSEGGSGRPALLLMPPGLDFVRAFFGCLYAGAIAVPLYPPDPSRLGRGVERLRAVIASCGGKHLLTTSAFLPLVQQLTQHDDLRVLATDGLPAAPRFTPEPHEVALLQYTSGSTSAPRGVIVSHANALANAAQIEASFALSDAMRLVTWLPPYHDMGLIGGVLQPVYQGAEVFGFSPLHFLQSPARWLQAISHFHANTSGGPNFGYELARRRITPAEMAKLDLSSWRIAFNGSEPVRAQTLAAFAEAFTPRGFSAAAFAPCYGLAEATLLVSVPRPFSGARTHALDAEALSRNEISPARDGERVRTVVSCGELTPGVSLAVVDPATETRVADGRVGELWLKGPNVARGYFGAPEGSTTTFDASLEGSAGWLRSGDLGAWFGGELLVTGRLKDLLIVRGRNLYPQDIERTVEHCHPEIRAGNVVALARSDEALCLVVEVRREARKLEEVLRAVSQAIVLEHDVVPAEICLVAPGSILKTSSGKLARSATREALESGALTPLLRHPPPETHTDTPVYVELERGFRRLDARSTRYRFDLERDIAWTRLDEPGDYYDAETLRGYGYDVAALKSTQGAWELFQWRTALSIAGGFELLEEALLGFTQRESVHFAKIKSVLVLEEEERKHVALFERYAAHLRAQRPEHAATVARGTDELRAQLLSFADASSFPSLAAYHYSWWLLILFFEELTVWLHATLARAGSMQPAWLSAHRAHAREEVQHVVTDFACLQAIFASEDERLHWSEQVFERVAPQLALAMSPEAGLALTLQMFPSLAGRGRVAVATGSPFARLLRAGNFSRTCAAGPYFSKIARGAPREASARHAAEAPAIEQFIRDWAERELHGAVGRDDDLQARGLDSLGAVALSGALERHTRARLPVSCVYDHPTPARLARFVASRSGSPAHSPTAPIESLLVRQSRLLALSAAHERLIFDHITAVFELPPRLVPNVTVALSGLCARHPQIWSSYPHEGAGFRAVPLPEGATLPLERHAGELDDDELTRRAAALDSRPFALEDGPPWRAELWCGETRATLLLTVHHVCVDGWSMEVLFREFNALCTQRALPTAPLSPGLSAEQRLLASGEAENRLRYWRELLNGHAELARRSPAVSVDLYAINGQLDASDWAELVEVARRKQATPYLLVLTAFHLAWQRSTSQRDLLLNTHLFNRATEEERRGVGYLVNLLTLRTELDETAGFDQALERVQNTWLEALEHELSIDFVVQKLFPDRYLQRWMPARVAFNWLLLASQEDSIVTWRHDLAPTPAFLFFEGMLVALPQPDGLRLTFWHDRNAFSSEAAQSLVSSFVSILKSLVSARRQGQ